MEKRRTQVIGRPGEGMRVVLSACHLSLCTAVVPKPAYVPPKRVKETGILGKSGKLFSGFLLPDFSPNVHRVLHRSFDRFLGKTCPFEDS